MKLKIIYYTLFVLTLIIVTLSYVLFKNNKKIGYVTTAKVFEEFKLKKELEIEYKKVQMAKQSYLDSIKLNIETLSLSSDAATLIQQEKIEKLRRSYVLKENQFNKENENLFNTYNDQIWKQLNQYIEDFGREHGFDYLFGANGQGNIMFAKEKEDCTKEITEYVNIKYSGKKSN